MPNSVKVRHATLLDVIGRPAKHGDWTIVPAEVDLDGSSFSPSFPLAEVPTDQIPPVLRLPIARPSHLPPLARGGEGGVW